MNMQPASTSPHGQVRHLARWQVQDLRHAFATTAKNAKKCSTAAPVFAGGPCLRRLLAPAAHTLLFAAATLAWAWLPSTTLAAPAQGCRFADDAPEQHLVVGGDTLWDLASRFLHDPWCWPRMWEDNREAVSNPHLIYPGQQIRLDRKRGLLTSSTDVHALPRVRLSPAIHTEAIAIAPIPLVSSGWLALLQKTPLMSDIALEHAAHIAALPAGRRMAGAGDVVYVRGRSRDALLPPVSTELRRLLAPVVDPDTGKRIALATRRLGRATWLRGAPEGLQVMRVTEAVEEVTVGDLLVDTREPEDAVRTLVPHAATMIQGQVAAILHDGRWATLQDIVALNRGSIHGLDAGSVVNVVRPVKIGSHEFQQELHPSHDLDEPLATLLVVEVLEQAALAIVMRAQEPFTTGAAIASPDGARR